MGLLKTIIPSVLFLQIKFYIQHPFLNKLRVMYNIFALRLTPLWCCLHSAAKWPLNCLLMFATCIRGFYIIFLSLWLPLLFKVSCRLFWSCRTSCYSVSFDKVYKERSKLVVILLPCLFFDGLVVCLWRSDVCRQYREYCMLLGFLVAQRLHCNTLCLQSNYIYPVTRTKFT